jgi:hypothetical protein
MSWWALPHLLGLDTFVIIFENNWRGIIKTYFSDAPPRGDRRSSLGSLYFEDT